MLIKFTVTKADWKKGGHHACTCPFARAIMRALKKLGYTKTVVSIGGMSAWFGPSWVPPPDRTLLPDEARQIIRNWDGKLQHPDKAQTFQIDVPDHLLTP